MQALESLNESQVRNVLKEKEEGEGDRRRSSPLFVFVYSKEESFFRARAGKRKKEGGREGKGGGQLVRQVEDV